MTNQKFGIEILSPEGIFFCGEAEFLEFTSITGEMGVYKNHVPLTTILEPCIFKIYQDGRVRRASVSEGIIQIQGEKIVVLAKDVKWEIEK